MVFEQFIRINWLETKEHAFLLAFVYSLLGILSAILIFPQDAGIMSVAFTAILLIPSLAMLLRMEENVEIREEKLQLIQLFRDHKTIFKIYIYLFLGILLAYSLMALFLPHASLLPVFTSQLTTAGITGAATGAGAFSSILINNLVVFIVCFILSLAYGAGAMLFLTWNASVWGVVFAYFARQSAADPLISFWQLFSAVLPHMLTEATAYICAAIVGGVVSTAALREKPFSRGFNHILTDALILFAAGIILVIIAAWIEVALFT